jgi:hypothetical protein
MPRTQTMQMAGVNGVQLEYDVLSDGVNPYCSSARYSPTASCRCSMNQRWPVLIN